jgi:type VI secretion system protein ImpF
MARRRGHLNPTLLDKLLSGVSFAREGAASGEIGREGAGLNPAARVDAFGEQEFHYSIRRELAWILNAVQLGSDHDLEPYPHVRTSVLNYGVESLVGDSFEDFEIEKRALAIREAIVTFEPRFDARSVRVTATAVGDRVNAVSFSVVGVVRSRADTLSATYVTDLAMDSGAATVRD